MNEKVMWADGMCYFYGTAIGYEENEFLIRMEWQSWYNEGKDVEVRRNSRYMQKSINNLEQWDGKPPEGIRIDLPTRR